MKKKNTTMMIINNKTVQDNNKKKNKKMRKIKNRICIQNKKKVRMVMIYKNKTMKNQIINHLKFSLN